MNYYDHLCDPGIGSKHIKEKLNIQLASCEFYLAYGLA